MSETRHNLELRGQITTVEPFANSPEGCKTADNLQKLPRIGGRPFIAASAIRGVLRRAAALEAVDLFPKGKVKYVDWLLFAVGGVKGGGDENCDPEIRHNYIENNPLVALFGAGQAAGPQGKIGGMIGSKLHIAHAIADDDKVVLQKGDGVIGGARAHENTAPILREVVENIDEAADFTLQNHQRAMLERDIRQLKGKLGRAAKNADGENIAADEKKKMQGDLKKKEGELKQLKAEMLDKFGTDNPVGMPLTGYEAIPAGTVINHRMTLAAVSDSQLGMFFSALERFALNPVVGAHRGHRCGRIRCEYDVYRHSRDDKGVRLRPLGRLRFGEPELPEFPKKFEDAAAISLFEVEGEALQKLRADTADWRKKADPENLRPYSGDGKTRKDSNANTPAE